MDELFSGAHPHLLINHAPIVGAVFALALFVASFLWAPDVLRRTALVVLIATGLTAWLADLTGDPAAHSVRGLPGVQREIVRAHEHMAGKALVVAGVLAVLALIALVKWRRAPLPRWIGVLGVLASAFVSGAMMYTGLLGGRVRHTEVRPGATAAEASVIEARPTGRPGADSSNAPPNAPPNAPR